MRTFVEFPDSKSSGPLLIISKCHAFFFKVRTEFLNIIQSSLGLKGIKSALTNICPVTLASQFDLLEELCRFVPIALPRV
jgi:hypothetical protein